MAYSRRSVQVLCAALGVVSLLGNANAAYCGGFDLSNSGNNDKCLSDSNSRNGCYNRYPSGSSCWSQVSTSQCCGSHGKCSSTYSQYNSICVCTGGYTGSKCSNAPPTSRPTPAPTTPPPTPTPTMPVVPTSAPTAPCSKTSVITKSCPGHTAGMMVPSKCSKTCADTYNMWWQRCKADPFMQNIPASIKTQLVNFGAICAKVGGPCSSAPCLYGATCTSTKRRNMFGALDQYKAEFTCTCAPGYSGTTCAVKLTASACSSKPCMNGGVCMEAGSSSRRRRQLQASYQCTCRRGFQGTRCETKATRNPTRRPTRFPTQLPTNKPTKRCVSCSSYRDCDGGYGYCNGGLHGCCS